MQIETVVHKMEEYIQDFRAQLAKKDLESVDVLTKNMTLFFDNLEEELPANSDFGLRIEEVRECAERFGKACEQNSMQQAASALAEMESIVQHLQRQCASAAA